LIKQIRNAELNTSLISCKIISAIHYVFPACSCKNIIFTLLILETSSHTDRHEQAYTVILKIFLQKGPLLNQIVSKYHFARNLNSVLWDVDSLHPTDKANSFLKLLIAVAIEAEPAELSVQATKAIGLFSLDF